MLGRLARRESFLTPGTSVIAGNAGNKPVERCLACEADSVGTISARHVISFIPWLPCLLTRRCLHEW